MDHFLFWSFTIILCGLQIGRNFYGCIGNFTLHDMVPLLFRLGYDRFHIVRCISFWLCIFMFHILILFFWFSLSLNKSRFWAFRWLANLFWMESCSNMQPLDYLLPSSLIWFINFEHMIFQWKIWYFSREYVSKIWSPHLFRIPILALGPITNYVFLLVYLCRVR